jgi:hypothetical protein
MTTTRKKTVSRPAKVSTVQQQILKHAAAHPDGLVPNELEGSSAAALGRAVSGLAKQKLVQELPPGASGEEGDGQAGRRFRITAAGLAAIGAPDVMVGTVQDPAPSGKKARRAGGQAKGASAPASSKADRLIMLLKRKNGATLDELTAASDWQAHSVRGFLSGTVKKRLGHQVTSERDESGVRRYRIGT